MKLYSSKLTILFFLTTLGLYSCLKGTQDPTAPSNDPKFKSLRFAKNSRIPHLEKAVFTLSNDTLIQNVDSLPFQTRIDSVFPTFTFASSSGAYLIYKNSQNKDSLRILTGKDTVNFSRPLYLKNTSSDGSSTARYLIKVNVHQVEPELYLWKQLQSNLPILPASENQHALVFGKSVFLYVSNGSAIRLFTSSLSDMGLWKDKTASLTGLPATAALRQMQVFNNKLYLIANENKLYVSSDGMEWTNSTLPSEFENGRILCAFANKSLIAIVRDKESKEYHIASTADAQKWKRNNKLNDHFPLTGYAALNFENQLGLPKVLIAGGKPRDASLPASYIWSSENGLDWVTFSEGAKKQATISNAALVAYDNKLLMFHGNDTIRMVESISEGFHWNLPNKKYNSLPETCRKRSLVSVLADKENKRLYIIGGNAQGELCRDVWTGKLNRMNWSK